MLDKPPLWSYLLFENPWPAAAALLLGAAVLAISNRHRREPRRWMIAGAMAIAAVAVILTAQMVTTEREHLKQHTRDLVHRVSNEGAPSILGMFDPDAVFAGPEGQVWRRSAEQFTEEINIIKRRFSPMTSTIRSLDAEHRGGDHGRSLLHVTTRLSGSNAGSVNTQWLFTWRKDENGIWRITEARFLRINNYRPVDNMWR